jgi:hypothetical protein
VLPQAGDQFRNAEILSAAGLVCSSREVGDVAAAIARGLDDSKLTERAAVIARDNAATPDVAQLAHHVAAVAPTN